MFTLAPRSHRHCSKCLTLIEQLIMGTQGSFCTAATVPSQTSFLGGLYLPAWLVRGVLRDELSHLVDTMLTFSTGVSGCPGIFPPSTAGNEAAIHASWVSIILLKLNWFLRVEDKVSSFTFKLSMVISLAKSFLFIFSLILAWPRTSSLKGGWFELKFELKEGL